MRKEQKTSLVKDLRDRFGQASIALVSEYKGMSAGETAEMRRKIRAVRGEMRVAKNTLVRRAIEGTVYAPLAEQLGGPVGLILTDSDPVELAKTVVGFKDLGDKFKLRGAVMAGQTLSAQEINALATLPPKEVVMAQLLGLLMAPATRLVRLLNEPGTMLARALDAIGKKNGDAAPAAAAPAAPDAPAAPEAPEAPAAQ
ncbi:MAG TPA: 50S ribosomal protein L10 [Candidatus Binataceae bacterium]|nr:50S ribosomal protein L10 [Candidatus Binataceae bacterium]